MVFQRPEELREALSKSGGRAIILVHPYYHQHHHSEFESPVHSDRTRYLRVLTKTMERTKLPVIVFEEQAHLQETKPFLRFKFGKPFFFVATDVANPDPVVGWNAALDHLSGLGLRHAIVGGQYLHYSTREDLISGAWRGQPKALEDIELVSRKIAGASKKKHLPYEGCVGYTVRHLLRKKFRVSLMPFGSHYAPPKDE